MMRSTALLLLLQASLELPVASGFLWLFGGGVRDSQPECGFPEFVDDEWEDLEKIPLKVAEAQGAFVEGKLVVTGGFLIPNFKLVTNETWSFSVETETWTQQDDCIYLPGLTHAGTAVVGSKMYLVGGYSGGHPGPALDTCFVFDHAAPEGEQWSECQSLPEPRSGGGLVYDSDSNQLIFSGGAIRPDPNRAPSIDMFNTWTLDLDSNTADWEPGADIIYGGNHISYATAKDRQGNEHYFFLGGQHEEDETMGNLDTVAEYDSGSDSWTERSPLPFPRGHASASTAPYGCGFIKVGGAINADTRTNTDDVTYYDIPSNSWTLLGDYPNVIKTAVCDTYEDSLYCSSGYRTDTRRRKLQLVEVDCPSCQWLGLFGGVSMHFYRAGGQCVDRCVPATTEEFMEDRGWSCGDCP